MYEYEEDYEEEYRPPQPKRRASATVGHDVTFDERKTEVIPQANPPPKRRQKHLLFYLGIGLLLMLGIWTLWLMVIQPWVIGVQRHWDYGDTTSPHVSELTANVGHGGTSAILAWDEQGQLTIVELVAGKAYVWTGGNFIGNQNQIITISLDSQNNLIVHVVGMEGAFVLFNTGKTFSWTK